MSTLSIVIVAVFIVGYLFIALEHVTKVNKAAIALLMFVATWTIFMLGGPAEFFPGFAGSHEELVQHISKIIEEHLGETGTTLFFLMGAMTIVELVDQNGGFNFVREILKTRHKRRLMWRIAFLTFILSAILDNLTTSIVMVMILRKLVAERKERLIYAAAVVLAANSGGAFSPIGDVTTIMLWNKGVITAGGVITELIIPSLVSMVVPVFILSRSLDGVLVIPQRDKEAEHQAELSARQRSVIFYLGVGGLIFVPIFKTITHLPPFVGILLVLGVLWTVTEVFYSRLDRIRSAAELPSMVNTQKRITNMLTRIDMSTILFFLGILMAVGCLQTIGALTQLGEGLDIAFAPLGDLADYFITGVIGILSSIVDNVPLVAGCMGMYPVDPSSANLAIDGVFWQLLAYCAGVGGSMLIIGSAAGVVVMGLEKISFGWYMKKITWVAFVGYLAGIVCYWVGKAVIGL